MARYGPEVTSRRHLVAGPRPFLTSWHPVSMQVSVEETGGGHLYAISGSSSLSSQLGLLEAVLRQKCWLDLTLQIGSCRIPSFYLITKATNVYPAGPPWMRSRSALRQDFHMSCKLQEIVLQLFQTA